MEKRLKLIGWFMLLGIVIAATILLSIFLCPIWVIIWIIWGWWFPKEVFSWAQDFFPNEVTS